MLYVTTHIIIPSESTRTSFDSVCIWLCVCWLLYLPGDNKCVCTFTLHYIESVTDVRAGGHRKSKLRLAFIYIAFQNAGKVGHDGDGVFESA